MSDQNGVPGRDRFMETAIFCSRTASPQTQYYPHAGWCYQTTPLGSNAQSKYSNNWDMSRTISNFESQRTPRLSWSRLTVRHLAQCRTLSLIASETRSPLWVFNVSKYIRQSCIYLVQFAIFPPVNQYNTAPICCDSDRYSGVFGVILWSGRPQRGQYLMF